MANNPTAITATIPATHLSTSQLADMLLASIRETFPAATTMEIDEMVLPGKPVLVGGNRKLTERGEPFAST